MTGTIPRRRIVIALGGNAISQRNQPLDADPQVENVNSAAASLAALAHDHDIVITHGNGPQVGLLALESSADPALARPYPLDALGAETQGLIGYWLVQGLSNAVPDRNVAALITRTVIALDDPAFIRPAKFIGPVYTEAAARSLATTRSWTVKPDGNGWRRVVASPAPVSIVELDVIEQLVDRGIIVVCGGGGGIPVAHGADGALVGVEAVIDKDLSSALIAEALHADTLLLLTDVAAISTDVTNPEAAMFHRTTPAELRRYSFAPGSMGPKVEAACRFVERTGGTAAIGALNDASAILQGTAGTIVTTRLGDSRTG